MIRKVFWDNPYQTSLDTTVSRVQGNVLLFSETIAFSFCGGQESDKAYVNDLPILNSNMEGSLIYYTLPDDHGLAVNDKVTMTIDWVRRYRLMRLHFAAELVLELVTRRLNLQRIGAHIAENKARIDFLYDQSISPHLPELLAEYNAIVENNLRITTGFSDELNQRRYWEIPDFTRVSCGGTHVKSTAEVGYVTLKRVNIGGGKERIEIKLVDNK